MSIEGIVLGSDGMARCAWGVSSPEYRAYHDEEWGRPVDDENRIYEHLCLEGFQSGLSWLTILRKRDAFRRSFASFDPDVVATFGEGDVDRLLSDTGIVRNRAKIVATIENAKATLGLREQEISLASLLWRHRRRDMVPARPADIPSSTPESVALSAALRGHGFSFVGPRTVYAAMQSLGVVNDHLAACHWRGVVEQQRRAFALPG